MATENPGKCISLVAAADYSSTGQFRFVAVTGTNTCTVASILGQSVAGVLQDNPVAGQPGNVMVGAGVSKVVLGGTVAAGDSVTADANGACVTISAGQIQAGVCLEGGAVGNIGSVLLTPGGLVNVSAGTGITLVRPAAADYSSTGQYLCAEIDSTGDWATVVVAGAPVNGVIQNAPVASADCIGVIAGLATVKLGATVAAGAQVMAEVTTGRAIAVTGDCTSLGTLIVGGDDGDDVAMIVAVGNVEHTHA